jgi:hypothetical protein
VKRFVGFGTTSSRERRNADLFYADLVGRPARGPRRLHPTEAQDEGFVSDFMQTVSNALSGRGDFPARPSNAMTGSAFMKTIAGKELPANRQKREDAIATELLAGNMPDFLRRWEPVTLKADGGISGTAFVMPDYLMIGSDQDYVYIPMSAPTAQRIADAMKAVLPTARLCHAIYGAAATRLPRRERDYYIEKPLRSQRQSAPKDAGQASSFAFEEHSDAIKKQFRELGLAPGTFVAGHKKDVIIAPNYPMNRLAFQGFYDGKGVPAEPCQEKNHRERDPKCSQPATPTFAHERDYSDYAHGARLIKATMLVDGEANPMRVADVLGHDRYHKLLSPVKIIPARVPGV